jgi:hypothetical protein
MAEEPSCRPGAAERLAAIAALACVTAAAVIVLAGVARNILYVLLGSLGLVLCAFAGWYVVSRRGLVRLIAAVIMLGALALLIASVILADIRIWEVVLIFVLSVASVASAQYALGRSPGAVSSAAKRRPADTAAHHPVLIMNLKSAGGKAERFHLASECRSRTTGS